MDIPLCLMVFGEDSLPAVIQAKLYEREPAVTSSAVLLSTVLSVVIVSILAGVLGS